MNLATAMKLAQLVLALGGTALLIRLGNKLVLRLAERWSYEVLRVLDWNENTRMVTVEFWRTGRVKKAWIHPLHEDRAMFTPDIKGKFLVLGLQLKPRWQYGCEAAVIDHLRVVRIAGTAEQTRM